MLDLHLPDAALRQESSLKLFRYTLELLWTIRSNGVRRVLESIIIRAIYAGEGTCIIAYRTVNRRSNGSKLNWAKLQQTVESYLRRSSIRCICMREGSHKTSADSSRSYVAYDRSRGPQSFPRTGLPNTNA
jgi:hypothetical protein